jgi:hypothetical protein
MRKRPGMNLWSLEIADSEAIVRGICSPYYVKKGKVLPTAYRPPANREDVSVMRCDWIGADACKQHSKNLEDLTIKPPKTYTGMAVLSARHIRDTGARVVDSREQFAGHADILHGIRSAQGEPPPAEQLYQMQERSKTLAKMANYFPDPDPPSATWAGPELRYKDSA